VVLLIGYACVYLPLEGAIAETDRQLQLEQQHLQLVRDTGELRNQFARLRASLPDKTDPNEWVQYVLGGIRQFPVKLVNLDSEAPRTLGPYRVVVLRVELEGGFDDLNRLLHWLETNQRLMRVDTIKVEPNRRNESTLVMQMTVLGVMS
jgi:hypothetical protein